MTALLAAAGAALLLTLTPSSGAWAQEAPKRLSDWLLEQPKAPDAYPLGLSWRVPEEVAAQSLLKRDLLDSLAGVGTEASVRLGAWVRELPVTGRVPVAVADARWLQGNPARDPVLQSNHRVVLPLRPMSVTVITDRGERCAVAHTPGREARAYVEACDANPVDRVWIAQPDGRVQRYGIALWNREMQDEPAPGAWIWAPARASDWPDKLSELLVRFLATQGPAPDGTKRGQDPFPGGKRVLTPFRVTASDWGNVGLLQTPTARMARAGSFRFNYSRMPPYAHGNIFVQPFDWLEAGFRYSNINNRPYDPTGTLNTGQSLKDKGFDAKFRLWTESAYVPEFAIGLRDLAGTGLFSGEYLVANKRTGDFDWSLGLAWGYPGGRGDVRNPLRFISKSFETRKIDVGLGGKLGFGSYFRGPAAFFGGVQYRSPWDPLILKLEYDGNDYQHEPQANNQRQRTPWNFGLVYRAARFVDLSLAVERGNTVMLGVTFHTDLDRMQMPKLNDPPRVPVAAGRPQGAPDWSATGAELARQTDWRVERITRRGRELRVIVDDAEGIHWRERVDRAAAVLHRDAPAEVDRFALAYRQRGAEIAEHVIDREAWVTERVQPLPPGERRETVVARDVRSTAVEESTLYERKPPRFESRLGMDFNYTLGGPDAFALYQFTLAAHGKLRLRPDTWVSGRLRLGVLDNYDKFKFTAPSELPRVRTFLREYLTTSALTLPNLQLTHVGKLSPNHYYSVYGGYLEEMFGGVGGEWLYRPFASRSAFGVDVNAVKQRDFHQNFAFRDYRTVTGHATWYWDTGWHDVLAKVSVGRYLAKDSGVTVDVSRTFRNGVSVGAFATKTNVSAAQFGEGSFDKGVYLSIPFDVMLTRSSG
ncbi:MAG: YjbH domain-containing protein, partial [Betaproteobacteria bacterium]